MYTLYIANKNYSSWSLRPWILLRQLELPFEEQLVPFAPGSTGTQFRAFSPSGKVPCLHDGDVVVWDSLAIVEFVAEGHPQVWPGDPEVRAWARSAVAEMHAGFEPLRTVCTMTCGQRIVLRERPPALTRDIERIDALWNEGLSQWGGPFLTGAHYTAVDAFFAPVVFRAQTYGLDWSGAAREYQARALALPGMIAWYEAALAERFRDAPHEEAIDRWGRCTDDLRGRF
jgi:glutathione S-transferase